MSRLRYSIYSPRAPRRYAGLLAGLLLAVVAGPVLFLLGYVGPLVTQAAAAGIVAAAGAVAL